MSAAPAADGLVVVTVAGVDPAQPWGEILAEAGLAVRLEPRHGPRAPGEMVRILHGAAGAILSTDVVDRDALERLPQLRVLARTGVGVDGIDLAAAGDHGVAVVTTPGLNEASVADHALALMLAAIRRIPESDAAIRAGRWERGPGRLPWDLHAAAVGLVGYGGIGRLVARRLQGFDVTLRVHDAVPVEGVEQVDLDTLLVTSDVVSIHVPLLPSTRGLIGARELDLLGPDGILVNTSRGGVVDEDALARALVEGRIRAAALDVFAQEPPAGSPLLGLPNCVLTPHVAGLSLPALDAMLLVASRSVVAVLDGREPPGQVVAGPRAAAQPGGGCSSSERARS